RQLWFRPRELSRREIHPETAGSQALSANSAFATKRVRNARPAAIPTAPHSCEGVRIRGRRRESRPAKREREYRDNSPEIEAGPLLPAGCWAQLNMSADD